MESNSTHHIRPIGEVYLPANSRPLVVESNPIKFFDDSDIRQPNRIFTHLKRGGLALVSGAQNEIQRLAEYLQRRMNSFRMKNRLTIGKEIDVIELLPEGNVLNQLGLSHKKG